MARGADVIVHIAGVNRASEHDVEQVNVDLASAVAAAVIRGGSRPRIVYANSIHAGNDSPYGRGKERAGALLGAAADECGGSYIDVRLPNLFGEHGRPNYNSFVATFVDAVIKRLEPQVDDRELTIMHAQAAAAALIEGLTTNRRRMEPPGHVVTVKGVLDTLQQFKETYARGDIPALDSDLRTDLFNTLRAAMFPANMPIPLTAHADVRGRLVETVRSHGGQGQTFVSTTRPGVTRGEHFHLRKVERFVVLSGTAKITLRKLFSSKLVSFDVAGVTPAAVDMPTMWAHNITNTGDQELTTQFWSSVLFDTQAPDTHQESVGTAPS